MLSKKLLKQLTDRELSVQALGAIKSSIVASEDDISRLFPNNWLIDIPSDEANVGGDFLFCKVKNGRRILALVDSIGHSLTGMAASLSIHVLMSMAVDMGITDPSDIIKFMHKKASKYLDNEVTCDIAIVKWNPNTRHVDYAGAKRSAHYQNKSGIYVLEPSRISIGQERGEHIEVETHRVTMEEGDRMYLATDGAETQPGGDNDEILKKKGFKKLLQSTAFMDFEQQKKALENEILQHIGVKEITDDIMIIGIQF